MLSYIYQQGQPEYPLEEARVDGANWRVTRELQPSEYITQVYPTAVVLWQDMGYAVVILLHKALETILLADSFKTLDMRNRRTRRT